MSGEAERGLAARRRRKRMVRGGCMVVMGEGEARRRRKRVLRGAGGFEGVVGGGREGT